MAEQFEEREQVMSDNDGQGQGQERERIKPHTRRTRQRKRKRERQEVGRRVAAITGLLLKEHEPELPAWLQKQEFTYQLTVTRINKRTEQEETYQYVEVSGGDVGLIKHLLGLRKRTATLASWFAHVERWIGKSDGNG